MLFDVGLTLIHPSGDIMAEEISCVRPDFSHTTTQDLVAALVLAAEARHLILPAGMDGDQKVATAWGRYVGLSPEDATRVWSRMVARPDLYCELDPDALWVLAELHRYGIRVGAVSNSDGTLREELAHFGLASYFDSVVDSTAIGREKPSQEIFDAAFSDLGISPDSSCFVGDGPINDVWGAQRAGIPTAFLYDRFGVHSHLLGILRIRELRDLVHFIQNSPSRS
ncbi:MAG: HAD family hydrolase [Mycobacteriales bacterium]